MQTPQLPRSLDAIEFEPTNLEEARAAHDALPPGILEVARLQAPNYWSQQRRKPLPTDRALTGVSLRWVMDLPEEIRPKALCERFPRIVNALSESWADTDQVVSVFEHLHDDRRAGRRGFPPEVRLEIELLCDYRTSLG